MALTARQIFDTARKAGFTPTQAMYATAIALAESGGNPAAHCLNCAGVPEDSRGLWQINVNAHPQYAAQNLSDPLTNARAAFSVSSGGKDFKPWSTYTSGAYKSHLKVALDAFTQSKVGAPAPVIGATADSVAQGVDTTTKAVASAASDLLTGSGIRKLVLTGVFVIGGVSLVVLGLYRGVQPTVQRVAQVGAAAAAL